jgi:iron complex outermembrane recepter protein
LQSRLPPNTVVTFAEPGSPEASAFETSGSRFFLSFYHTLRLEDLLFLNRNSRSLDVLNGNAISGSETKSRHEFEFKTGIFKHGLGANLAIKWQNAVRIQIGSLKAESLKFTYSPAVDVNLFLNLSDRVGGKARKFLQGTRIALSIKNMFNTRTSVRDAAGLTPTNYQSAILDPEDQFVSVSLRKNF